MAPKSKPPAPADIEQAISGLRAVLASVQEGTLGTKGSPESRRFATYVQGAIGALEAVLGASAEADKEAT
jgi:hypothetical protein